MGFVDKESFKRKLIDEKNFYPAMVARALEEMPDADVVEVKHGEWERVISTKNSAKWRNDVSCSVCHSKGYERYDYCPHCGAKMDGGKTE